MNSIKLCPKCKEIMYVEYSGLTDTNTYLVKCKKCGLTEKVKPQIIPESEFGNHIHFECQNCKQKERSANNEQKENR